MLEANKSNLIGTIASSSTKLFRIGFISNSSFNLQLMVMDVNNAPIKSQWPLDWFIKQALTIEQNTSTKIFKIC